MRCPHCNATNTDTATFCGQCYERFPGPEAAAPGHAVEPPAVEPPAVGPSAVERPASRPDAADDQLDGLLGADLGPSTGPPGQDGTTRPTEAGRPSPEHPVAVGRFVADDGGLSWRCAICETTHPVGVFVCTVCGAKMDAESTAGSGPPVDLEHARRLEAIVPGLGHLRTGHTGMGAARIGIVAIWLLGSLVLASGGPSGLLTALPMVVGMAVVWGTGPGDLAAAAGGRPTRLDARRFMYLVIGVTTGVIIAGGLVVIL